MTTLTPLRLRWSALGSNWLLLVALGALALPGGSVLALALLLYLAFRGQAGLALIGTILLTLSNPVLFDTGVMTQGRWLIIGGVILAVWPGWRVRHLVVNYLLICLAGYLLWNALMVSELPTLSLFRGLSFVLLLWVLFNTRRIDWRDFSARLDWLFPVYILLNLPILAFPAAGLALNNLGFQGLTQHPQTFGVLLALVSTWLFARLWGGQFTAPKLLGWLALGAALMMLIESQARTAVGATAVGCVLVWLVSLYARPGQIVRSTAFALAVLGGLGYVWQSTNIIQNVIYKERFGGQRESLDVGLASRNGLIALSQANHERSPWVGIGFGAPSVIEEAEFSRDPVFGVPLSTNNEKGVWVTAVLEELGWIGLSVVIAVFTAFAVFAARRRAWLAVLFLAIILIINLGETIMFSVGALGGIAWLLFFATLFTPSGTPKPEPAHNN